MKRIFVVFLSLTLMFAAGANAQAAVVASTNVPVTVTVTTVNNLTLTSSGTFTFDPITGKTGNVTFTIKYALDSSVSQIQLYTWFSTPSTALSISGGSAITSGQLVATLVNNAGTVALSLGATGACNGPAPVQGFGVVAGGACPAMGVVSISSAGLTGSLGASPPAGYTATESLAITGYTTAPGTGLKLPAGTYAGTLSATLGAF